MLKGGVLLAAYDTRRPTCDIDLQATSLAGDADTVLALVRAIAAIHKDDGLVYDADTATAEVIRDEEEYSGCASASSLTCHARIPFRVDVNIGDPIWPPPENVEVPRLSGEPSPCVVSRWRSQDFAIVLQDVSTFARPAVAGDIAGLTWIHSVMRWMP